jgi:hypothetical protein
LVVEVLADKTELLLPAAFMAAAVQVVPLSLRVVAAEVFGGPFCQLSLTPPILLSLVQEGHLLD